MNWNWYQTPEFPDCWFLDATECHVSLQPRPTYCDRGRWIARVEAWGALKMDLDEADGWPRYYFELTVAKSECEAWLRCRGQGAA